MENGFSGIFFNKGAEFVSFFFVLRTNPPHYCLEVCIGCGRGSAPAVRLESSTRMLAIGGAMYAPKGEYINNSIVEG